QTASENPQTRNRSGETDHYVPGQSFYQEFPQNDRRTLRRPRPYHRHPLVPDRQRSHGHRQPFPRKRDGAPAEGPARCHVTTHAPPYYTNRSPTLTGGFCVFTPPAPSK